MNEAEKSPVDSQRTDRTASVDTIPDNLTQNDAETPIDNIPDSLAQALDAETPIDNISDSLIQALDAETATKKNYHIRRALQYWVIHTDERR